MTWTQKRKAALEAMWRKGWTAQDDDVLNRILVALSYLDERLQRGRTDVR